ncbi:unnamed protein product [Mytilus coruscus]|uniref:Tyrosinase copper-binding domain-containing protein n=1 Tax=Mytilus coruscus TaxID=42192 RepID=A0A6J8E972_MYTCO|nr:unnamed protein product [Mytilus coruscus]
MNIKTYLILISLLVCVICDVKRTSIPTSLRRCLHTRDRYFPMTDEQISTTCLLEFLWLNRQICDIVSKQTFDWLASLVEKSQQRLSLTPLHASVHSITRSEPQTTIMSQQSTSTPTPFKGTLTTTATKRHMKKRQTSTITSQPHLSTKPRFSTTTTQPQLSTTTSQPQTTRFQLRQRKEYRMLTDQERDDYHKAINDLKRDTSVSPNKYDALAEHHQKTSETAHGGVAFGGWHRYYLFLYELALQEKNPNVMLPYWDSTLDSSMDTPTDTVIFTDKFLGNAYGNVTSGPFGDWERKIQRSLHKDTSLLITKNELSLLISKSKDQREFMSSLEMHHNGPHVWIGGTMVDVDQAPFDPIFYMHHAFIDCIWERYRVLEKQRGQNPEIYPSAKSDNLAHQSSSLMVNLPPFNNVNLTNADGYKNFWTETYYSCAPQPSCSVQTPECGSKWLECDIFTERCVSKGSEAALPRVTPSDVFRVKNARDQKSPTIQRFTTTPPATQFGPLSSQPESKSKKITAEEFFSTLKSLKKLPLNVPKTPSPRIRRSMMTGRTGLNGRTGIPGRLGPPSILITQQLQHRMLSIDGLKIPKFKKPCCGHPIQNSFRIDCKEGTDLWVFVPIKVVNLRHGDIVYSSYPVNSEGRRLNNTDVFSVGQQLSFASNLQSKARSKHKPCSYDKSGLFKVKISSYGLNYYGIYEDTVFLDNRRTVSTEISYVGIRNPEQRATRVFITAVDECGIACQPMILMRGYRTRHLRYRKNPGAIEITTKGHKYHSSTYRGAESLVWKADTFSVPQPDENQIPIVFVCDYRNKNPWS